MFEGLKGLIDFIIEPLLDLINSYLPNFMDKSFKLGLGQVEFFDLTFNEVIVFLVVVVVWVIFIKFIYWIIKNIFNLIVGWLK